MPDVRRVHDEDAATLRSIRLAALQSDPEAFSATWKEELQLTDEDWQARVDRASSGNEAATFLSHEDDEVSGIVTMLQRSGSPSSVELVSMWTDPRHRSSGTGTALVEAGVEWARVSGFDSVQLWVMSDNEVARSFYERRGFVEIDPGTVPVDDPCRDQTRMELQL